MDFFLFLDSFFSREFYAAKKNKKYKQSTQTVINSMNRFFLRHNHPYSLMFLVLFNQSAPGVQDSENTVVGAHYSVTVPSPNTASCVKCCEKKLIKKITPASRLVRA